MENKPEKKNSLLINLLTYTILLQQLSKRLKRPRLGATKITFLLLLSELQRTRNTIKPNEMLNILNPFFTGKEAYTIRRNLKEFNLIDNPNGHNWKLTPKGEEIVKQLKDNLRELNQPTTDLFNRLHSM